MMNIPMEGIDFTRFCQLNEAFWLSVFPVSRQTGGGSILIDLWHDVPGYLLRSLLIAKHWQSYLGGRLVGLTGSPGVVYRSCGAFDGEANVQLAKSFGVETFWKSPEPSAGDHAEAGRLLEPLAGSGIEFRKRLKALALPDGYPIGRFIYDTTVRGELSATVRGIDEPLLKRAAEVVSLERWIGNQLREEGPVRLVCGHLDYDPWGLVAEKVRRSGGEVLAFRPEDNVPLCRIVADAAPAETLNEAYFAAEAAWFNAEIWPHHEALAASRKCFQAGSMLRAFYQKWTAHDRPDFPYCVARVVAAEWKRQFNWSDSQPVVVVFAHAYGDQPIAGWQLYDDRFNWLEETLAFAAGHPERNWLIKVHPLDAAYDLSGASRALMNRFGGLPHIRFAGGGHPFNVVQAICDIGVTIMGAPGAQMVAAGKPVITAGDGPYAGCGFVHRPQDIDEYQRLLLADPESLAPTVEQVERAGLYLYACAVCGTPASPLLRPLTTPPTGSFWRAMASQLRSYSPFADDLFQAVRALASRTASEGKRVQHPDFQNFFGAPPGEPRTDPPPPPLLTAASPLTFEPGGAGCPALVTGFSIPENWGVYEIDPLAFLALRVEPGDTPQITLLIDYHSRPEMEGWLRVELKISANGVAVHEAVLDPIVGALTFTVPRALLLPGDVVVLCFACDNMASPAELGMSEDYRRLGIGLKAIRTHSP